MTIYWTLRSIPELADLPRRERGRFWRTHVLRAFKHWQPWAGLFAMWLSIAVGAMIATILSAPWSAVIALAAPLGFFGGLLFSQLLITTVRPYLRAARPVS